MSILLFNDVRSWKWQHFGRSVGSLAKVLFGFTFNVQVGGFVSFRHLASRILHAEAEDRVIGAAAPGKALAEIERPDDAEPAEPEESAPEEAEDSWQRRWQMAQFALQDLLEASEAQPLLPWNLQVEPSL
eukprot:g33516.t1